MTGTGSGLGGRHDNLLLDGLYCMANMAMPFPERERLDPISQNLSMLRAEFFAIFGTVALTRDVSNCNQEAKKTYFRPLLTAKCGIENPSNPAPLS